MSEFVIVPHVKGNGKLRYVVKYGDRELGSFFSQANARRFIEREARPALVLNALLPRR